MQGTDIDEILARAGASAPSPDAAFLARIEADGLAVQAGFGKAPATPTVRRGGTLARWIEAMGGGAAVAGLAATGLVGVWIGATQPAPVAAVTSGLTAAFGQADDTEYVELIPGFDSLGMEG